MTKRKAQFFIDKDKEDEESLPDVGVINTPQEIQERKILKIRGPKTTVDESKIPKLHITVAPPTFNNAPQTPPKKTESKLFFNTQPLLQLPEQPKLNIGLASPLIEFKCTKISNDKQLSPVKESEEYILYKYKLKRVTIDNQEHNQEELLLIVSKNEDTHTLKIEESTQIIIEGIIENNKIHKNEQIIKLECNEQNKLHTLELEFIDAKDYEQFNI